MFYMALMPLIQPPVMRLLTTKKEQEMGMPPMRKVTRLEKIVFPIVMAIIVNMFFPPVMPLITMLMLGNLLKEVLMVDRLARTAAGGLMNVITITLTLAIGSTMAADTFVTVETLEIVFLGLVAFVFGTGQRADGKGHEPVHEGEDQSAPRVGRHRLRADRRSRVARRCEQGQSQ